MTSVHCSIIAAGTLQEANLIAELLELLFRLVDDVLALILDVNGLTFLLILSSKPLGVLYHAVHLITGEGGGARDLDVLLAVSALICSRHAQDAVGVNVETHLHLRASAKHIRPCLKASNPDAHVVFASVRMAEQKPVA